MRLEYLETNRGMAKKRGKKIKSYSEAQRTKKPCEAIRNVVERSEMQGECGNLG
jgi:hypothetical protein